MIKFFGKAITFIGDVWKGFPFEVRIIAAAGVGVLLVLLFIFGQIGACRTRREERKIERIEANIQQAGTEANVLSNMAGEKEKDATNANSDLDRVLGTDSGDRESDFGTVRDKWCRDHAGDSKCSKPR